MISCVVVFDGWVTCCLWRHTPVFARILREIWSDRVVVLKNSFRN